MSGKVYETFEQVLLRGREAIGKTLREIDKTGRIATGKGAIGTVIEESWFEIKPSSFSQPDFAEAGVELKVTPYTKASKGLRAKERLVCNIINYMTEHNKTFATSSFWIKCNTMLLMLYRHDNRLRRADFVIDEAVLFKFPLKDLVIIEQDWQTIIGKIRAGKAHELSEGDTLYLGACTKGRTSADVRRQPFSTIPAKQRAYALKQSYMTYVLNAYIFGNVKDERIIKNPQTMKSRRFESYIEGVMAPYIGREQQALLKTFGIKSTAKDVNERLLARIFGIRGRISAAEEFKKANIIVKTIRVQKNGRIKESMSFPAFKFLDLVKENWDNSTLKTYLEPAKFLFVIFQENEQGNYILHRIKFWNIPTADLDEVEKVWRKTVQVLKEGVVLQKKGNRLLNNFPKQTENRVAHVRPHAQNANDTYPLPDGRVMPKQSFWLNRTYIEQVIKE